jgi:hypothetical protein
VVTTSSNVPEASQGYDAGKRTKGRKQHIATDTLGLLLAVVITAASVQDTNGGKDVTARLAAGQPSVTAGRAGGGYKTGFLEMPPRPASASPSSRKSRIRRGSPGCPADGRSSGPWDGSCCTGGLPGISRLSRNVPPR